MLVGFAIYSLIILFLKVDPYDTNKNTYFETVRDASEISNELPVLYMTSRDRNFKYYLEQYKFKDLHVSLNGFRKNALSKKPEAFFIMADLKHNTERMTEIVEKQLFLGKNYEIHRSEIYQNMYDRKFTQLIYVVKK